MGSAIELDSSVSGGNRYCVQGNVQVAEMMTLQGQLSAAAVAARQVAPLHSSHPHGTRDDGEDAEALSDQWAEATSGPPSTGASTVHGLVESTASLLMESALFYVSVDCRSNYAVPQLQCNNVGKKHDPQ